MTATEPARLPETPDVNGAFPQLSDPQLQTRATWGSPSGISGSELTDRTVIQAEKVGARISVPAEATALERRDGHHLVRLDDGQVVAARTVVVATGARYRYLADRIECSPGIEILRHTEVRELFVFIGAEPYTRWLGDQLALDDRGFVLSGADARRDAGRPSAHPRIPGGRVDAGDGLTNCLRGSLPSNSPR